MWKKASPEADIIVEDEFDFPMIYHYSMEPHVAIAQVDHEGITIWTSTGHPFGVRADVCADFWRAALQSSGARELCRRRRTAASRRVKLSRWWRRWREKRSDPVRVVTSVAEAMVTCRRHSIKCKVKTGAKNDGTLTAKQAEIFLNTGAYAETGPIVAGRTLTRILGPYPLSKSENQFVLRLYQHGFSRFVPLHRRPANGVGDGISAGYARGETRHRPRAATAQKSCREG
jgi:hypothetical protein